MFSNLLLSGISLAAWLAAALKLGRIGSGGKVGSLKRWLKKLGRIGSGGKSGKSEKVSHGPVSLPLMLVLLMMMMTNVLRMFMILLMLQYIDIEKVQKCCSAIIGCCSVFTVQIHYVLHIPSVVYPGVYLWCIGYLSGA